MIRRALPALPLAGLLVLGLCASAAAEPVATVRGPHGAFEIDADRLRAYLAEHPERSPRAALDDLIAFELLAAEARAAGLADDPAVQAAVDRAAATAWLRRDFEARWTPEKLPEALVRQSYQKNRRFFDHPQLRVGEHILVTDPDSKRPTGEADAVARALAERIRQGLLADPPGSPAEFRQRGQSFADEAHGLGLEIKAQSLGTFPRRGRYADEFEDAAFGIEQLGVAAGPFPSRFGWHIIRIDEIIPEKHQSFADVEAELRARVTPEVRQLEFLRATDRLAAPLPPLRDAPGVRGLLDPVPLDAVAVRRGLLPMPGAGVAPADGPPPAEPPAP